MDKEVKIRIPLCFKCSEVLTGPIENKKGIKGFKLTGCKKLTQKEWDEGDRKDATDQIFYQHNCPMGFGGQPMRQDMVEDQASKFLRRSK